MSPLYPNNLSRVFPKSNRVVRIPQPPVACACGGGLLYWSKRRRLDGDKGCAVGAAPGPGAVPGGVCPKALCHPAGGLPLGDRRDRPQHRHPEGDRKDLPGAGGPAAGVPRRILSKLRHGPDPGRGAGDRGGRQPVGGVLHVLLPAGAVPSECDHGGDGGAQPAVFSGVEPGQRTGPG